MKSVDGEPTLNMYSHKAAGGNAYCFLELRQIVQGTENKVYMEKFDLHSDCWAAWRNLYNTFLRGGTKDTLAADLENTIQHKGA